MASLSPMGDAALGLAGNGFSVLPCWATNTPIRPDRAKKPIGSLTPNGFKQATRDHDIIRRWWTAQPDAMIGIVVDPRLFIIDIDPRNGGSVDAVEELAESYITATRTVWSGRNDGGRHLYFWRPDGTLSASRLPAGVDLKTSGYVIAPPSLHPVTGEPYRWDDQPIADPPAGLVGLLTPTVRTRRFTGPARPGSRAALVDFVARQQLGNVNKGLHWAASRAAESGCLDDAFTDELVAAAVQAGESDRKARRTVESAEHSSSVTL